MVYWSRDGGGWGPESFLSLNFILELSCGVAVPSDLDVEGPRTDSGQNHQSGSGLQTSSMFCPY